MDCLASNSSTAHDQKKSQEELIDHTTSKSLTQKKLAQWRIARIPLQTEPSAIVPTPPTRTHSLPGPAPIQILARHAFSSAYGTSAITLCGLQRPTSFRSYQEHVWEKERLEAKRKQQERKHHNTQPLAQNGQRPEQHVQEERLCLSQELLQQLQLQLQEKEAEELQLRLLHVQLQIQLKQQETEQQRSLLFSHSQRCRHIESGVDQQPVQRPPKQPLHALQPPPPKRQNNKVMSPVVALRRVQRKPSHQRTFLPKPRKNGCYQRKQIREQDGLHKPQPSRATQHHHHHYYHHHHYHRQHHKLGIFPLANQFQEQHCRDPNPSRSYPMNNSTTQGCIQARNASHYSAPSHNTQFWPRRQVKRNHVKRPHLDLHEHQELSRQHPHQKDQHLRQQQQQQLLRQNAKHDLVFLNVVQKDAQQSVQKWTQPRPLLTANTRAMTKPLHTTSANVQHTTSANVHQMQKQIPCKKPQSRQQYSTQQLCKQPQHDEQEHGQLRSCGTSLHGTGGAPTVKATKDALPRLPFSWTTLPNVKPSNKRILRV